MKKKNTIPLLLLPLESSPELSNVGGARSGSMVVARVVFCGYIYMYTLAHIETYVEKVRGCETSLGLV